MKFKVAATSGSVGLMAGVTARAVVAASVIVALMVIGMSKLVASLH